MLKPLFSKDCELVAWVEIGKNIYDTDMEWIAYIADNSVWSVKNNSWLGSIDVLCCTDRRGKVVAWNPDCKIENIYPPTQPFKPFKPFRPFKPFKPFKPFTPFKPFPPNCGWSDLTFDGWINQ